MEYFPDRVETIESAAIGADPEYAIAVLFNYAHTIIAQRRWITRTIAVMGPKVVFPIEFIEPAAVGSYPEDIISVLVNRPDDIVAETVGCVGY